MAREFAAGSAYPQDWQRGRVVATPPTEVLQTQRTATPADASEQMVRMLNAGSIRRACGMGCS